MFASSPTGCDLLVWQRSGFNETAQQFINRGNPVLQLGPVFSF